MFKILTCEAPELQRWLAQNSQVIFLHITGQIINSYLMICIFLSAFPMLSYPKFDCILVGILSISIRGEAITESIFRLEPTFTQLLLFKIPLIGGAIDPLDKLVIHRLKIPLCFRI